MTLRKYGFWVMDLAGKRYINLKFIQSKRADGTVERPYRGVYLAPESRDFEKAVRVCAKAVGVELMEWIALTVYMYWPLKDASTKHERRVKVPLKGKPDLANVYKSGEDSLQRLRVPGSISRRIRGYKLEYQVALEANDAGLAERKEKLAAKAEAEAVAFKTEKALVGAAVKNDSHVLELRAVTKLPPPTWPHGPCVYVVIREVVPERYYTKETHSWLEDKH